ncbi:MAG: ABC transporter ATP-binding protein [Candidatus Omnitrophota bacterium]|nr:ABC transporter ATP-binding protein [Candidatus Omnitrophota bacterium]
MSDPILTARGLHKIYKNGAKDVRAVDGIDFEIGRAKAIVIVGPSGAGKSTLLHIMGGLDKPTSGEVQMDGGDIYKLSDRKRAAIRNRRIGFVFQFYHLLNEFTALENVMLPALMKKAGGNRGKALQVLDAVGLKARAGHKPSELSGGELQRAAIARALVNEPEILLCDEPTGNLDSKNREAIYELLFGLKAKYNMSLVIVTHDENISEETDELILVKDGRICR